MRNPCLYWVKLIVKALRGSHSKPLILLWLSSWNSNSSCSSSSRGKYNSISSNNRYYTNHSIWYSISPSYKIALPQWVTNSRMAANYEGRRWWTRIRRHPYRGQQAYQELQHYGRCQFPQLDKLSDRIRICFAISFSKEVQEDQETWVSQGQRSRFLISHLRRVV